MYDIVIQRASAGQVNVKPLRPAASNLRTSTSANQQEVAVSRDEMVCEAAKCREQARHFGRPERELLLEIANAFDEMAQKSGRRHGVAALRCW